VTLAVSEQGRTGREPEGWRVEDPAVGFVNWRIARVGLVRWLLRLERR
jgi:hypothetical protein